MRRVLNGFRRDARGNVVVIFALALLPLATAVGAAVDYSNAASIHSGLQAGADAAALSACKANATTTAELRAQAQAVLDSANPGQAVTIDNFQATNNPRSVSFTARVTYRTYFMKIANITTMPIAAAAACGASEQSFEIALVLDTTGSMSYSAGTTTKIEAMKTAAKSFVNQMFTSFDTNHMKISLVPFAASVKVNPATYAPNNTPSAAWLDSGGQSSIHWQNVLNPNASGFTNRFDIFKKLRTVESTWGWAGCLESLPYPRNTRDDAPTVATPDTLFVPLFAPDEPGNNDILSRFLDAETRDNNSVNSYMDDGQSSSGSCDKYSSNRASRQGQACKYTSPRNIDTSDDNGPNFACTSRALTTLTNNKSTLLSEIDALQPLGSTNIHEGVHWGWRTVSPNGVFSGPVAYGTPQTTKVIVLMTDGVNQWRERSQAFGQSYYSAYGYFNNANGTKTAARLPSAYGAITTETSSRNAIDQLVRETCTNAKATPKNIVIYTVAFSTPGDAIDASGQALIRECASGDDKYFLAQDSASLNSSFAAIAQGIGALRITR